MGTRKTTPKHPTKRPPRSKVKAAQVKAAQVKAAKLKPAKARLNAASPKKADKRDTRSTLPVAQGAHCSFCGKPENQVARLLSGGGEQPVGVLPVVNICNECIALCNRILLDRPSPRQTPWTLFITKGERFEWAAFTQDDGSTFMMVRRFNNDKKSFGLVLERGDAPSTELAKETVLKVPEYF